MVFIQNVGMNCLEDMIVSMINRKKNLDMLVKRFGWSERFASEFLVEFRSLGSFYNAYEQALQSVWVDQNQKPDNNPFKKEA